ncbi:TPA: hypothetical protein ACHKSO_005441, partial [Escherichia coli]
RCCRFNWSTQQLCENMGLRRFEPPRVSWRVFYL